MLGPAAVPLIQSKDVEAARKCLGRDALHVVRIARRVEAVEEEQRAVIPWPGLPMAVREGARAGVAGEIAGGCRRQPWKIARIAPTEQRHLVAAAQQRPRDERLHRFDHTFVTIAASWRLH